MNQVGDSGPETSRGGRVSVGTLTMMVVGGMVGAGVFSLPRRFATETGIWGALIAWAIAGGGMLMLAFVFQALAIRKPALDSGVYAYAKAGFGEYLGFFSAFGYWASACVGNTTYWILIMSTLGALVPAFGEGNTLAAVGVSTVGVWGFAALVARGTKEAANLNRIVTIAKLVPIVVFILLCLFMLDLGVLRDNLGGSGLGSIFTQVKGTMLITVFVFLGVEGASVYSRYARRREDVGRATVLGFISVLAVFASVTVVSYGILPRAEIAELRQPSMAGILEAAVGGWGAVLIGAGLIVSVLGAYLAWSLMAAEVLYVAAKDDDMPRFLGRTNAHEAPINALIISAVVVQVMLFLTMASENAFDLALNMTSALSLIPFVLAAAYLLRITISGDGYADHASRRRPEAIFAVLATVYTVFLLYAAGPRYMLLSFVIYAPGSVLFIMARREQRRRLFAPNEVVILVVSTALGVLGIVALATGWITI